MNHVITAAYAAIAIHFLRKILRKLSPAKPMPRSLRPPLQFNPEGAILMERLLAKPHSVYFDCPDGPFKLALCQDAYTATAMLVELRERLVPCFMREDSESVDPVADIKLREYAVVPLTTPYAETFSARAPGLHRATLEATSEVCRRKTGKVHPKARGLRGSHKNSRNPSGFAIFAA